MQPASPDIKVIRMSSQQAKQDWVIGQNTEKGEYFIYDITNAAFLLRLDKNGVLTVTTGVQCPIVAADIKPVCDKVTAVKVEVAPATKGSGK